MSRTQQRLGRGLDALLGRTPQTVTTDDNRIPGNPAANEPQAASASGVLVREIPLDQIVPNPRQPRTVFDETALHELTTSIRANGVLQPVLLRQVAAERYELIAGERRVRASRMAGLATVPAIVRTTSDAESFELALVENIQRSDLNALERATAYQSYLDAFGISPEQLAVRLGESRSTVANHLRLLALPGEIRQMLAKGELSMGHARAIAAIGDPARQLAIALMSARRNLSVRQVEALAQQEGRVRAEERPRAAATPVHIAAIERSLSHTLGAPTRVQAGRRANSGKIIVSYRSLEEFERITEKLGLPPESV